MLINYLPMAYFNKLPMSTVLLNTKYHLLRSFDVKYILEFAIVYAVMILDIIRNDLKYVIKPCVMLINLFVRAYFSKAQYQLCF